VSAHGRSVVAIAGALLVAAGCSPPPDCVQRCGEYKYNDHAMLRLCRFTAFNEPCPEPWTVTLVRPDRTAFRGLGDVDELSIPRSPSASWVLARRTVPSPPPDVASMGAYLVYDLATDTVGYEGTNYGVAYDEWVHRNGVPETPDSYTILVDPYDFDDFAEHFPPTWSTWLRDRAFAVRWAAAFGAALAIALWPLSLAAAAGAVVIGWLLLRLLRRRRRR
jgi:hypothetical protein